MVQEQRKLKEILKQRGISAYRLAIDCHIATTNIYNCLNGKQYMYPKWRKTIAEYLKDRKSTRLNSSHMA